MTVGGRVPVTLRALLQRINRVLAKDTEVVKATRPGPLRDEVGEYYRLDLHTNRIIEVNVDLEKLGRKLGALRAFERLEKGKAQ